MQLLALCVLSVVCLLLVGDPHAFVDGGGTFFIGTRRTWRDGSCVVSLCLCVCDESMSCQCQSMRNMEENEVGDFW